MNATDYKDLRLSHPFMFVKIAMNPRNGEIIIGALLNQDIHLEDPPVREKFIQIKAEGKFVRLDLFAKDEQQRVYDAEMQNPSFSPERQRELPKRSRFYQSLVDSEILDTGAHYKNLKELYIIFICTFDPFGKGLYQYTFRNRCDEKEDLYLDDACTKIFFNTTGDLSKAPKRTRDFLEYIQSQAVLNEEIEQLNSAVEQAATNEEWRSEYMLTFVHDMDVKEAGIELGMQLGREEGIAFGEAIGMQKGEAIGCQNATRNILLRRLSKLGDTSHILSTINKQTDPDILNRWVDIAMEVDSIDAFEKNLHLTD